MATQTTNLNLVKPDYTDAADIAVINTNMDTIDSHVHGNDVDIAGIATIIKGTTNNSGHSISSGEYFIANGAKYKASATIGTGVTWSDKATSVSDHDLINALNSKISDIHYLVSNYLAEDKKANDSPVEVLSQNQYFNAGNYLILFALPFTIPAESGGIIVSIGSKNVLKTISTFGAEQYVTGIGYIDNVTSGNQKFSMSILGTANYQATVRGYNAITVMAKRIS